MGPFDGNASHGVHLTPSGSVFRDHFGWPRRLMTRKRAFKRILPGNVNLGSELALSIAITYNNWQT